MGRKFPGGGRAKNQKNVQGSQDTERRDELLLVGAEKGFGITAKDSDKPTKRPEAYEPVERQFGGNDG